MRRNVRGWRRATVAVGVSLALGAGSMTAPVQAAPSEPEFGSSVEDPYAAGVQLPKMQPLRIGNVVLPGELVGVASVLGLLAIIATIAATVTKAQGGQGGSSSGEGSSRLGLKPDEYRADNGAIYKVNPQARNFSTQQATALFPRGAGQIGSTLELSKQAFEQLHLREGDVLSIPPSAKFPGAAMAKIVKVEEGATAVTVETKPAILDDIIEYTKGDVKFQGRLLTAEPMTIIDPVTGAQINAMPAADAEKEAKLELTADLKKLAESKRLVKKDALSKAELTGGVSVSPELGINKEAVEKEADKSFELKTKIYTKFEVKTGSKIDVGEDLGKAAEEYLQKRFGKKRPWLFPVGPVWVYMDTGVEPTFELELSAERARSFSLEASKEGVIGFKYDADSRSLKQISREASPGTFKPEFSEVESTLTARLEPGVQATAALWKTFNGALGASLAGQAERKNNTCTGTLTLNAPKGEITVESPLGGLLGDWAEMEFLSLKLTNELAKKEWDLGCGKDPDTGKDPGKNKDQDKGKDQPQHTPDISDDLKHKMLNMTIPAVCMHDSGRLIDGRLEESSIRHKYGFVDINTRIGESFDEPLGVNAKWINVDGKDRILLVAQCFAGGVGWPQSLFLLDENLNFVETGPYGNGLTIEPQRPQARRPFYVFETEGDKVKLKYGAADERDAMAAPSLIIEGTYRVDGQRLVPVGTPRVEKLF